MGLFDQFLIEINERSKIGTPFNDHLLTLFNEARVINPQLIVELGVEFGESTFALERVAKLEKSILVSVDLQDCSRVCGYQDWFFVQRDDIQFAGEFSQWCSARRIKPRIDILFIDTSHLFDHTCREIATWFPLLSKKAKVFFHDTNCRETIFRKNGSSFGGWNNERGVIRALEAYFGKTFNETVDFTEVINGWLITHVHYCSGFTILERT